MIYALKERRTITFLRSKTANGIADELGSTDPQRNG
jgi:hypothetical protein